MITSTLWASRMSSVLGLKASPSTAIALVVQRAERLRGSSSTRCCARSRLIVHHRAQELEVVAERGRGVDQRVDVLGEARAAVAEAGLEERGADARSSPMPLTTWLTSAPAASQRLAISLMKEILVARKALEAYLMISAERHVGDDHRPLERRVELEQRHRHLLVGRADHDAVGAERVLDGRALAQELGVRDDVEVDRAVRWWRAMISRTRSPVPTGTVDLFTTTL